MGPRRQEPVSLLGRRRDSHVTDVFHVPDGARESYTRVLRGVRGARGKEGSTTDDRLPSLPSCPSSRHG